MPHFQDLQTGQGGTKYSVPPQLDQKYYCESKETCFSYSLDKAFHLPEFRANLFFKGNWVGGFYRDSLLNRQPMRQCTWVHPEPAWTYKSVKIFMLLNMVIAINW